VIAVEPDLPIAFVGTYPPRRCGIATFTASISSAIAGASPRVTPFVVAMTDTGGLYEYPSEVRYEVRQGARPDYARAAEFINYSGAKVVSLQHEHGIFGGDDGSYVLDLLNALRVPTIATLHTVLKQPTRSQRLVIQRLAMQCAGVVVMSQVAADLLGSSYDVGTANVRVIPHGIPDMAPHPRERLKARFGIAGSRMLLTFGLLGPSKGIEVVLRALPRLVAEFPDLLYFVVGATHPHIVRRHGEAYRTSLEREAEELGVRENVVFRDQFVTNEELCSYIQAADVFVSPYHNEAQVTSGALSYAMGAGAAVVSTPYWHAQELLADRRGRLFGFDDSAALAGILAELLGTPTELERLREAAHAYTRPFVWSRIGAAYLELVERAITSAPEVKREAAVIRASSLPELRLDHLARLTDDTGVIQHATYSVPARISGYCVDDNARALIVALRADRVIGSEQTRRLVGTYLAYLYAAQKDDGSFRNLMGYDRTFPLVDDSHDCVGRAVWALGTAVALATDDGVRRLAAEMLQRALPAVRGFGPRGTATTMLGLAALLDAIPDAHWARDALASLADALVRRYGVEVTAEWRWFEPTLTYDNAMVPLALFAAYGATGERASLRVARESLEFLEEICFRDGTMLLVGNSRWHTRGGDKPHADEQAIDAAAFVLAFRAAYRVTGDRHYVTRMRQSFAWFVGKNRLGAALYDSSTGGCRDGLGDTRVNENQGAESTISFLLALLEMLEVAHEGRAPVDESERTE
jgi:glycosyltransferase involved in cell wall biosynthesis